MNYESLYECIPSDPKDRYKCTCRAAGDWTKGTCDSCREYRKEMRKVPAVIIKREV